MLKERQAAQEYFRALLLTVMGQALSAAGYHLKDAPLQWAGGKFDFRKQFTDGFTGDIVFQVLVFADNMWADGAKSRFTVTLTRGEDAGMQTRSLSQLVVADFGVAILPNADHWWSYDDTDSLGKALAEAGHLLVGYGIPWLARELEPAPLE